MTPKTKQKPLTDDERAKLIDHLREQIHYLNAGYELEDVPIAKVPERFEE